MSSQQTLIIFQLAIGKRSSKLKKIKISQQVVSAQVLESGRPALGWQLYHFLVCDLDQVP